MKLLQVDKLNGTERVLQGRDAASAIQRIARHLEVTPDDVRKYFNDGMGVETSAAYYKPQS